MLARLKAWMMDPALYLAGFAGRPRVKSRRRNRRDVAMSDQKNLEHLENLDIVIYLILNIFEPGCALESLESLVRLEGKAACGNGSFFPSACADLSIPRPRPGPGPGTAQISGISPEVLHHRWDPHSPDSGMATGMATGMAMHWAMHGQRHVPCYGFN